MSAIAYTRFDPRAALRYQREAPAKPAKPAKVVEHAREEAATCARFATFAAEPTGNQALDLASEKWGETHEERAGIIEYDGNAPRVWAEALARLDPNRPPCDISPKRWLQFIDDCGRFLDKGWAARAEELGWGPLELFGCDRVKPFARLDRAGLLWLLNGGKLVALTAVTATIETTGGARQTYRRSPIEVDAIAPAWELAP